MSLLEPILVTGGTGFLGTRVTQILKEQGLEVRAMGKRDGDLTLPDEAERWVSGCRTVLHLAARVGGIGANREKPYTFWRENVLMGLNVIDALCRQDLGQQVIVAVGSICEYPLRPPAPFREASLWDGYPEPTNAPYGVAKRSLGVALEAARQEHHRFFYAYPILTNLYGPGAGSHPERSHVIPGMIRKLIEAKHRGDPSVTLWGSGAPTRDFLHVEDAARAVVACAEHITDKGENISVMNFGSGEEMSIFDLANRIRNIVGYDGALKWDTTKPDGQYRRVVDWSNARDVLGWAPQIPFEDGLRVTAAWYRENLTIPETE